MVPGLDMIIDYYYSALWSQSAALSHSAHFSASHVGTASAHSPAFSHPAHDAHDLLVSAALEVLLHAHEAIESIAATIANDKMILFIIFPP
jgi:hypothetical protein